MGERHPHSFSLAGIADLRSESGDVIRTAPEGECGTKQYSIPVMYSMNAYLVWVDLAYALYTG